MSKINSKLFRDDPAAYYTELGAEAERERIIKLLFEEGVEKRLHKDIAEFEGQTYFTTNAERYQGCGCCSELDDNALIALIKGERE